MTAWYAFLGHRSNLAAIWFVERGLSAFQQMASIRIVPVHILEKPTTGGVNSVVVSAEHMSDNDNKMATLLKTLFSKIVHLSESLRNFLETYAAPLPFQQRSPLVEVCKIERGVGQARRTYSTTSCHQQVATWYFRGVHLRDQRGRCGNRQCS